MRIQNLSRLTVCLALILPGSLLAEAVSPTANPPKDTDPQGSVREARRALDFSIRNDRADGGYGALLEIHADGQRTLRIVTVKTGGPADRAGLEPGDLIWTLDGKPFPAWQNDLDRVYDRERRLKPGQEVSTTYERRGEVRETTLVFDAMSPATQRELFRWIESAEQWLADGNALYCHDKKPSKSGTHYVCYDDSEEE